MKCEKSPGIQLEFKDLDSSKRTAVIKHSVYNSIDRVKDIATKGMFTKSWNESKPGDIDFLFNHKEGANVGSVKRTFEDDNAAFTEVKFGNWTLGNDVLEMASEDVLKGASFGYITEKKDYVTIKGQKVRKLKEVKHVETSLLTLIPAHPEAGIVTLNKAFDQLELKKLSEEEQNTLKSLLVNDLANIQSLVALAQNLDPDSDLYGWIMWNVSRRADATGSIMDQLRWNAMQMKQLKSHVDAIEKYCTKAKASDETIIQLLGSIEEYKKVISEYDTAFTFDKPDASDIKNTIQHFIQTLN